MDKWGCQEGGQDRTGQDRTEQNNKRMAKGEKAKDRTKKCETVWVRRERNARSMGGANIHQRNSVQQRSFLLID